VELTLRQPEAVGREVRCIAMMRSGSKSGIVHVSQTSEFASFTASAKELLVGTLGRGGTGLEGQTFGMGG
jgi:hypothetical protein